MFVYLLVYHIFEICDIVKPVSSKIGDGRSAKRLRFVEDWTCLEIDEDGEVSVLREGSFGSLNVLFTLLSIIIAHKRAKIGSSLHLS